MEENTQNQNNQPIVEKESISNKNRNILLSIIILLGIIGIVSYILFNKNQEQTSNAIVPIPKDSTEVKVVEQPSDTIKNGDNQNNENRYDEEEEYEYISAYRVIAKEANLRTQPNSDASSIYKTLQFGDKIFVDNSSTDSDYSKVYLTVPQNRNSPSETTYYISSNVITYEYDFNEYKENFSLNPFIDLNYNVKKSILENNYSQNTSYSITQNAGRAKYTISYGDYDGDGIKDVAVVLDNNEDQESRLLVLCTNKATKRPYLAYADNFNEKIKISTLPKGAKLNFQNGELMASSNEGLTVKSEYDQMILIYDPQSQKFKYFRPETGDE